MAIPKFKRFLERTLRANEKSRDRDEEEFEYEYDDHGDLAGSGEANYTKRRKVSCWIGC